MSHPVGHAALLWVLGVERGHVGGGIVVVAACIVLILANKNI